MNCSNRKYVLLCAHVAVGAVGRAGLFILEIYAGLIFVRIAIGGLLVMRKRATANVEMVEEGTLFKCALCHKIGLKGIHVYRTGSSGIYICEECLGEVVNDE